MFLGRQAIFDRHRKVCAYELLFRPNTGRNEFDGTEASLATKQVIETLLSIGSENILRGKQAYLNFDHALLREGIHLALPRETTVIEILETVEPTADLLALCRSVRKQGYTIALDDFIHSDKTEALIPVAQTIKVELRVMPRQEQEQFVGDCHARGIQMLAEKVETPEEFQWALDAGYDLFQGYFFAKPEVVRGRRIPAVKMTCLRLLDEMAEVDLNFSRIAKIIGEDVSLTYKLLRSANSALVGSRTKIRSIDRSLVVIGEDGLRRWAALATLPTLASDKPTELVTLSLVRAGFCERLMQLVSPGQRNDAFLTGMFSALDALIDCPLEEALEQVNLGQDISEVLLGKASTKSILDNIYRLTRRYEAGDWDEIEGLAKGCGLPTAAVGQAYLESTVWADGIVHASLQH